MPLAECWKSLDCSVQIIHADEKWIAYLTVDDEGLHFVLTNVHESYEAELKVERIDALRLKYDFLEMKDFADSGLEGWRNELRVELPKLFIKAPSVELCVELQKLDAEKSREVAADILFKYAEVLNAAGIFHLRGIDLQPQVQPQPQSQQFNNGMMMRPANFKQSPKVKRPPPNRSLVNPNQKKRAVGNLQFEDFDE